MRGDLAVQPIIGIDGGEGLQGTVFLGGEVGIGDDPKGDPKAEQENQEENRNGEVDFLIHRLPLEDIVEEGTEGTADHVGHGHGQRQAHENGAEDGQAGAIDLQLGIEASGIRGGGHHRHGQERQCAEQLVAHGGRGQSRRSHAHHTTHDGEGLGEVGVVEDHPADADQDQGPDVTQHAGGGGSFKPLEQESLFQGQDDEVEHTPQDEVPGCTVPKSREEPDHAHVEELAGKSLSVAAQGDVDVLAEPGGQGDVPPSPEVGDGGGQVGVVEVFQELKAQHATQADGHVGVAREIEVDVQGVGQHQEPGGQHRGLGGVDRAQVGVNGGQGVAQEDLLGKSYGKAAHARGELVYRVGTGDELIVHVPIADDGARDELGEQGHVGAKGDVASLGVSGASVQVDGVGHDLEGVEADADGEGQPFDGLQHSRQRGDHRQVLNDEIGVLEEHQHAQIETDRQDQPKFRLLGGDFPIFSNGEAREIRHRHREKHDHDVGGLAKAVEDQAQKEQHKIPYLQG